ncbi:MAG: molybdopterin dinucleotide binding domain-containing protein [Candidatus Nezhaarchaeales archaeon]
MKLELNLLIESFHDFEKAKRLGSLSDEYCRESAIIYLSQEDSSVLGVSDGDIVEVSSKHGLVKVRARVRSDIRRGLAFMPPSPYSMALVGPDEYLSIIKVTVSKSSGEPTSLTTLFTS